MLMDDVILNKISKIEKCIKRIKEEYEGFEKEFYANYTKQDSIILNIQRACEATIDIGIRLIRINKLTVPQSSRDVFVILEDGKILPKKLCVKLQSMIGFRNIAVHDYRALNVEIVRSILEMHLNDFLDLCKYLFKM